MNVTAYIHPERLLVATWTIDEGIPSIHAYKELDPSTPLELDAFRADQTHIVIHSSDVQLHWFPIGQNEDLDSRLHFEGNAWRPDTNATIAIPVATSLHADQSIMRACAIPSTYAQERCSRLASSGARYLLDVDYDIQSALAITSPRTDNWLLLGKRGSFWQATVIGPEHHARFFATYKHDDDYDVESMVRIILRAIADRYGIDAKAVMLYGDGMTEQQIIDMKSVMKDSGVRIARLQPFQRVRSLLDHEAEQRLLRKAHVIGPLAADMILQPMGMST